MRNCASTSIGRMASLPSPSMSAARELTTWDSVDAYMVSGCSPRSPLCRTLHPAIASRASLRPANADIAPPLVTKPPAVAGSPSRLANQRTSWSSISVAPGANLQPPTFWLMAAASRSAAAPGIVPAPEMKATNPG